MNRIITIGDKEVGVSVNALTPKLYHEVFHKNFFEEIQNITTDIGVLKEVTYIMAKRYEAGSPDKMVVSEKDYMSWLEGFDMFDFEMAGDEIAAVIGAQMRTTVVPKK